MTALTGGSQSDTLTGGNGNDRLKGGEGADMLSGGNGADDLDGDGGTDTLFGGNGDDTLDGGAGDDRLFGDAGNDYIYDDGLSAVVYGNDTIFAGDGNDRIYLSGGADIVDGGAGHDNVSFNFENNRTENISITFDAESGTFQSSTGAIVMNVESIFASSLSTGTIWFEGGNGDDWLWGGRGDGSLFGGKGNDRLDGGSGDEILDGGDGNDFLYDRYGGENTLTGGAGADVFGLPWNYTEWSDSFSFITDFSIAEDKIGFIHPNNEQLFAGSDYFLIGSAYTNADQRILYNSETGMLSYDVDGNGSAAAIEIAQLDAGLALTAAHFKEYEL